MGLDEAQIAQPIVGVVSSWNEAAPCNISLRRQAEAAKRGVTAAGGTPREFTTITVTDGIAMGHAGMKASLVSRETIADSVELTVRGHTYDALVAIGGCDSMSPRCSSTAARSCRGAIRDATSPCSTCSKAWASTRRAP
jgi:dihydroxy-acid dehydratase